MKDYKTTALASTPGYALHIASVFEELGIHPEELSLRVGIFGAEPWSENLRTQIEEALHITAYDNYGSSEIMGPGVSFECEEREGLHINEDHFIVEVVDPDTLASVEPGAEGELVFTTITKQGFPLIRYRTGDITSLITEPCRCGRTTYRMRRVTGRTDDMLIIDGINVFPSQIEEVLLQVEGTAPHYLIVLDREAGIDTMEIRIEVPEELPFGDEVGRLQRFKSGIQEHLDAALGIKTRVTLAEPKTIARSTGGKMKRVIDKREL